MKSDDKLERAAKLTALLEESVDPDAFSAAMQELEADPDMMGSLMAMQFVRDAVRGNPTPDLHYTQAIMQFIARAEAQRAAAGKDDSRSNVEDDTRDDTGKGA